MWSAMTGTRRWTGAFAPFAALLGMVFIGCSQPPALVLLEVQVEADVPPGPLLKLSATAGETRPATFPIEPGQRPNLRIGYYMSGATKPVIVKGEVLSQTGCALGDGTTEVRAEGGETTGPFPLVIRKTSAACGSVDAAAGGNDGASDASDGRDASSDRLPAGCTPPCAGSKPVCVSGVCVACQDGSEQCNVNTPERCQGGAWVPQTPCGGTTPACSNGVCAPARVIGGLVTMTSAGTGAVRLRDQGFEILPRGCVAAASGQICATGGLRP